MTTLNGKHYSVVVIGAGMSGLAASIRLAMYDHSVLLLERHNAAGGLNSFYRKGGQQFDVGLHALTNWVPEGVKGTPLGKIFRQLRIKRESFDLCEQTTSAIRFPSNTLCFSNDFEFFRSEIADQFPEQIENFDRFTKFVREYHAVNLDPDSSSAREEIRKFINDPLLIEMLMCPLLYYGSARENDMDFGQFVVLFQAIFLEGFCRPFEGVRPIIRTLLKRAKEVGVERRMGIGVKRLHANDGRIQSIELDTGEMITADHIISSMGANETECICSDTTQQADDECNVGKLSFSESIAVLDRNPREFGFEHTIVFFNDSDKMHYERPADLVDYRSGVICVPNNYDYGDRSLKHGVLRVTAQANYHKWVALGDLEYEKRKSEVFENLIQTAVTQTPGVDLQRLENSIQLTDIFTPKTVTRFTGHFSGAVYGAPQKTKDGKTRHENLYLCGTDQGFLGIVGSMLSGISIANYHVLKGS